jgi:hypothetical protein
VAEVRNADLIRGVLDGGQLQFKMGRKWIDCGGDADAWISVLATPGWEVTCRIKPATDGVRECPECGPVTKCYGASEAEPCPLGLMHLTENRNERR